MSRLQLACIFINAYVASRIGPRTVNWGQREAAYSVQGMNTSGQRRTPFYLDDRFTLIVAIVFFFLAFTSAAALWGDVGLVDILVLFFGGFFAGAGVAAAAVRHRLQVLARRRRAQREEQIALRSRRGIPGP